MFEEAAVTVLRRSRRPLTLREIVGRMVEEALARPTGKTPHKSLQNIVVRANQRRKDEGLPPRFVRHRDGRYIRYSLGKD